MKKIVITLIILLSIGFGAWFAYRAGWFNNTGPDNLPTAEERARMAEIERSSATIAPNATPGVGVKPAGSTPPAPAPAVEEASLATSTESIPESLENTQEEVPEV